MKKITLTFLKRYRSSFRAGIYMGLMASIILILLITAFTLNQSKHNGNDIKEIIKHGQEQQDAANESNQRQLSEIKNYIRCVAEITANASSDERVTIENLNNCDLKRQHEPINTNILSSSSPAPAENTQPATPTSSATRSVPKNNNSHTTRSTEPVKPEDPKPEGNEQSGGLIESIGNGLKDILGGIGL